MSCAMTMGHNRLYTPVERTLMSKEHISMGGQRMRAASRSPRTSATMKSRMIPIDLASRYGAVEQAESSEVSQAVITYIGI